jgi:hypothetical protein
VNHAPRWAGTLVAFVVLTSCTNGGPSAGVAISVVSTVGPKVISSGGPFAATTMAGLLKEIRFANAREPLNCAADAPCWVQAHLPSGEVLVAVQPALTTCWQLTKVRASWVTPTRLTIDLSLRQACTEGSGTAAMAGLALLTIPRNDFRPHTSTAITVTGRIETTGSNSVSVNT